MFSKIQRNLNKEKNGRAKLSTQHLFRVAHNNTTQPFFVYEGNRNRGLAIPQTHRLPRNDVPRDERVQMGSFSRIHAVAFNMTSPLTRSHSFCFLFLTFGLVNFFFFFLSFSLTFFFYLLLIFNPFFPLANNNNYLIIINSCAKIE